MGSSTRLPSMPPIQFCFPRRTNDQHPILRRLLPMIRPGLICREIRRTIYGVTMAEITASKVNELRSKTGLGMMECKKALTESGGDIEQAIGNLRKKGIKTSITERAATEGRVAAAVSSDRKRAAAVELVCNTDFTAKSEVLAKIADEAVKRLLSNPNQNLTDNAEIKNQLTAIAQQTGENVQLGRTAVLEAPAGGTVASYLYSTAGKGKI